jgi:hypothetical protein
MTKRFQIIIGFVVMLLILAAPGIMLYAAGDSLIIIFSGVCVLPIMMIQNSPLYLSQGQILIFLVMSNLLLLLAYLRVQCWWVVRMTGAIVIFQLLFYFWMLSIIPGQT